MRRGVALADIALAARAVRAKGAAMESRNGSAMAMPAALRNLRRESALRRGTNGPCASLENSVVIKVPLQKGGGEKTGVRRKPVLLTTVFCLLTTWSGT